MDSINRQQPEVNRADLRGPEAVACLQQLARKALTCFFCTAPLSGGSIGVRPMSFQRLEDDGTLWFLSASDSHKNAELAADPAVKLFFQGARHSDFLQLNGTATVSRDQAKIRELWEPILKTWFTEGVDDPRLTAIRFVPGSGYYWTTKHGYLVAGVKMIIGAAMGRTLDDSIEGHLHF